METKFELFTDHKSLRYIFSQKDLNQRQVRWLEFLAAYDLDINYTPGKANAVADALSRNQAMTCCNLVEGMLFQLSVSPALMDRIIAKQYDDTLLYRIKEIVLGRVGNADNKLGAHVDSNGVLKIDNRICVPNVDGLRQEVLKENHNSSLSFHPGVTKMYQNMKKLYW